MQKKCVKYITPKIMDRIRLFIDKLSKEISTPELTNVYSPEIPQSEVCRENLYNYLHRIKNNKSKVMLIGEAPGYHGCRLSGIAFTCEENFTEDIVPEIMGKDLGYKITLTGNQKENFRLLPFGLSLKTGIMLMVPCLCYGISVLFIHIKRETL